MSSTGRRAAIFLVLTGLGIAGNWLGYQIFFSIFFIFGSIFSMLALQLLPPGLGLLSTILVGSTTYFVWNHPYALVIAIAEALVVLYLWRRRGVGLVLADAFFWVLVGMPLVFLFYYGVMNLALTNATVMMLKQGVNGVVNCLVARFAFMLLSLRVRRERFSLREIVFSCLIVFTLAPVLTFIAVQSKRDQSETDQSIVETLKITSERATQNLRNWLGAHTQRVTYISKIAESAGIIEVQAALEHIRASDGNFLRMGLLDAGATAIAYSPLFDEAGKPNIGKNFADRPFIHTLRETLKPMLSEVVIGRTGKPEPIVTVLSPVVRKGAYAGYTSGTINLAYLRDYCDLNTKSRALPGLAFHLLDKNGKIIVTSSPGLKMMETLSRASGETHYLGEGIYQWIPEVARNISVSDKWKRAVYISESEVGSLSEWQLILEVPVEPFQLKLYSTYTTTLARLWAALIAAFVAAHFLTSLILSSLEELRLLSSELPETLAQSTLLEKPRSAIRETEELQENFLQVIGALRAKFAEINAMNLTLEERIGQRTEELSSLNAKLNESINEVKRAESLLQGIFDSAPLAIGWAGRTSRIEYVNRRYREVIGYDPDRLGGLEEWYLHAYPDPAYRAEVRARWDALEREALASNRTSYGPLEAWVVCADGVSRCFDIYGSRVFDAQLAIFSDITERKNNEKKLSAYAQSQRVLLREVNHRVKNNLTAILGMFRLEAAKPGNEQAGWLLKELEGRVRTLASVHSMLSNGEWRPVKLHELCEEIVHDSFSGRGAKTREVQVSRTGITVDSSIAHNLALVFNELATNTGKHAAQEGVQKVEITFEQIGKEVSITYRDNGPGFPEELLNGATQPVGIGLKLVRGIIEMSLGGVVELKNDGGAVVTIHFPLREQEGEEII